MNSKLADFSTLQLLTNALWWCTTLGLGSQQLVDLIFAMIDSRRSKKDKYFVGLGVYRATPALRILTHSFTSVSSILFSQSGDISNSKLHKVIVLRVMMQYSE